MNRWHALRICFFVLLFGPLLRADEPRSILAKPGIFKLLTERPCSYCSTQNRKQFVKPDDRVLAWIRASHNEGAVSLRHFLSASRVVNDTYGLFFYDPDGGYVTTFKKDYGYDFHGWRDGVQRRWYAWAAEFPQTEVEQSPSPAN
ncbi:MAG: hypothetical protein FJ302_01360 [Planctomycetes bacterium]|nr:hypothetical protein [Planctomycetota bacterium]